MTMTMVLRWTPARKALVLAKVADGRITEERACARYGLSAEELAAWQRDFAAHGLPGLRTTRGQIYRGKRE